jgi:hypothetical protein
MLGAVMAQIVPVQFAKDHAVGAEQACGADFRFGGPARGAICVSLPCLARSPDRHGDRDNDGGKAAGCRDQPAFDEDARRIAVERKPPPEEGRRRIKRQACEVYPRPAEFGLIAEAPGRPLGRRPNGQEHGDENSRDLSPEHSGCGHGVDPEKKVA